MKLSLVPLDGEKAISDEEKERMQLRMREIPPAVLGRFNDEHCKEIKDFLASLITLSEGIHHQMIEHAREAGESDSCDEATAKLQSQRQALFDSPSMAVRPFIELLRLHAMEPWPELEMMIASIRGEDVQNYGVAESNTATDDSHVDAKKKIQQAKNEQIELTTKCRITPHEIKDLVHGHSLETLVKHLIEGRRMASGAFWNVGHYDL